VSAITTRSKTVQSVDRAVMLLRALAQADEPVPLAALAGLCGLERPTAWRLLLTLQTHGLVERGGPDNGYQLAFGALELSSSRAVDSLARIARPLLTALANQHEVTASLAYVERFGIVYIDQVDSAGFATPNWVGRPLSLHGSSPGKAVLAALPPAEARGMLGPTLPRLTDTTITDFAKLATELVAVREAGYAVSRGEDVTYSNGASAAVMEGGRPFAAFDLWGPERIVPVSRLPELGAAAAAAASELRQLITDGSHPGEAERQ
jgi:DNA-binding IclR family transcriptional regulator